MDSISTEELAFLGIRNYVSTKICSGDIAMEFLEDFEMSHLVCHLTCIYYEGGGCGDIDLKDYFSKDKGAKKLADDVCERFYDFLIANVRKGDPFYEERAKEIKLWLELFEICKVTCAKDIDFWKFHKKAILEGSRMHFIQICYGYYRAICKKFRERSVLENQKSMSR